MLKITNQLLMAEALKRGWQAEVIDESIGLVEYTDTKGKKRLVMSTLPAYGSGLSVLVADNKLLFGKLCQRWGVPVPKTEVYQTPALAQQFLKAHKQVVVKPLDSAHGQGITTDIKMIDQLKQAVELARTFSGTVLLQQQAQGDDYRLLFIGGKLAAAAIRVPAQVTGDGQHTIGQLIDMENLSENRALNYTKRLNTINKQAASVFLGSSINDIPKKGSKVTVVGTANIGTGGYSIDVTDKVPSLVASHAQTLVDNLNMPVCGVDFMYNAEDGPFALEINAAPSLGLHTYHLEGESRPVVKQFIDWLATT